MTSERRIYFFGTGEIYPERPGKEVLGGKGFGLARMAELGIPVPPGFTIPTSQCNAFLEAGGKMPAGLDEEVREAVKRVEQVLAKETGTAYRFGDPEKPLLVSVRSGGRVSMPGMMDTVLNLGLNDVTVKGLAAMGGGDRFAYDSYRRLLHMYGDVVMGVEHEKFEAILSAVKKEAGVDKDNELDAEALKDLVARYGALIEEEAGRPMPTDPMEQLLGGIAAVFDSWNTPRAVAYRNANDLPHDWGTAVNVQTMVFGNMGDDSATGVAFTRNPSTGENKFYGEYLLNAQGEDVVAGIRTPGPIAKGENGEESLQERMPEVYDDLVRIGHQLEQDLKDMQDVEFTVQNGKLWMLQTRSGKRTAEAAVRVAVEMVDEGLLNKEQAVLRVEAGQLDQLLHPRLDPTAKVDVLAVGLPASPGAASGKVVFHPEEAEAEAEKGVKTILVRVETSPEDIRGMIAAQGVLTARGGMTSHAAVVSRGMGRPCVAGCRALDVDYEKKQFSVGERVVNAGDIITLDGSQGRVILGDVSRIQPTFEGPVQQLMNWADELRRLKVRTNADNPKDSQVARDFGAEGIGLCRTEHMFFEEDRIDHVREMILADSAEGRRSSLAPLLEAQRSDFEGIFRAMDGLPVTIRLLDPPLHEFLPREREEIDALAGRLDVEAEAVERRVQALSEFNPMLGHRGVRLGITAPEIYRMQVRAILEAALNVRAEGATVLPEIMVPLVATRTELAAVAQYIEEVAGEVFEEKGDRIHYLVGTMIELPRACVAAGEIAEVAEFFSFGTNDLTQTTFGLSRDDAGSFLPVYVQKKLVPKDPFVSIDVDGVGRLMEVAVKGGRDVKPKLKLGICGEHGGEPASVAFCHKLGLDYVSCSPYRVPIARLAAAQAAVRSREGLAS